MNEDCDAPSSRPLASRSAEPNGQTSPDPVGDGVHLWEVVDEHPPKAPRTEAPLQEDGDARTPISRSVSHSGRSGPPLTDAGPTRGPLKPFSDATDPAYLQQAPPFPIREIDGTTLEEALHAGAPIAVACLYEAINRMRALGLYAEAQGALDMAAACALNFGKLADRAIQYSTAKKLNIEGAINWQEDIPDYADIPADVKAQLEEKLLEIETLMRGHRDAPRNIEGGGVS